MNTSGAIETAVAIRLGDKVVSAHPKLLDVISVNESTLKDATVEAIAGFSSRTNFKIPKSFDWQLQRWELDFIVKANSGAYVHIDVTSPFTHDFSDADKTDKQQGRKARRMLVDRIKKILLAKNGIKTLEICGEDEARKVNYYLRHL